MSLWSESLLSGLLWLKSYDKFMTIVFRYNSFSQADNSVSTGVEKVTRITVHCKLTKNFWQRQIQQVLATNDIEWNKEQMIRWLCSDAPEMSMEEAWHPRPKLPPKGKTLPKAQRTRGLSSYHSFWHKFWSNFNFRNLTKLKLKIFTKPSFQILDKIQLRILAKPCAQSRNKS